MGTPFCPLTQGVYPNGEECGAWDTCDLWLYSRRRRRVYTTSLLYVDKFHLSVCRSIDMPLRKTPSYDGPSGVKLKL